MERGQARSARDEPEGGVPVIRHLLVPLDGSALAERALPYALHLASAMGARLTLMQCGALLATGKVPDFDVEAFAQQLREGEAVGALRASRRIEIEAVAHEVYLDKVAEGICDVARDREADLIVMSTHGRGGFRRLLYGSVADQVLRHAPAPVLLVSSTCDRRWKSGRPFRILVPLDGSLHSERALGIARDLSQALRPELLLVRTIEEPTPESYRFNPEGEPTQIPEGEEDLNEARLYLETVAGRQGTAFASTDVLARLGEAAPVIADAARDEDIDLIVMATHGRTGLERLAMGSVATKVLQFAHTPILLVRPEALSAASVEANRLSDDSQPDVHVWQGGRQR
jgi:nucleotide-binding universal stress UspA family protein